MIKQRDADDTVLLPLCGMLTRSVMGVTVCWSSLARKMLCVRATFCCNEHDNHKNFTILLQVVPRHDHVVSSEADGDFSGVCQLHCLIESLGSLLTHVSSFSTCTWFLNLVDFQPSYEQCYDREQIG